MRIPTLFLLVLVWLLVAVATATAGPFQRFRERRAARHTPCSAAYTPAQCAPQYHAPEFAPPAIQQAAAPQTPGILGLLRPAGTCPGGVCYGYR